MSEVLTDGNRRLRRIELRVDEAGMRDMTPCDSVNDVERVPCRVYEALTAPSNDFDSTAATSQVV